MKEKLLFVVFILLMVTPGYCLQKPNTRKYFVSVGRSFDFAKNSMYGYRDTKSDKISRMKIPGFSFGMKSGYWGGRINYEIYRNSFYRLVIPEIDQYAPEMAQGFSLGVLGEVTPLKFGGLSISIIGGPVYGRMKYLNSIDGYAIMENGRISHWQKYVTHNLYGWAFCFGGEFLYQTKRNVFFFTGFRFDSYKVREDEYEKRTNMPSVILTNIGIGYSFKSKK